MSIIDKRPEEISPEVKAYDELLHVYQTFGPDTGPFTKGLKRKVGDALSMLKQITASRDYHYNRCLDLEKEIGYLEQEIRTMQIERNHRAKK